MENSVLNPYFRQHIQHLSLAECQEAKQLLENRISKLYKPELWPIMDIHIEALQLSSRAYNALKINRINTVGDILVNGLDKLGMIRNVGSLTEKEVRNKLIGILPK
ncbi:MAG TPA: DNA-directed RNA polymerase subunit alpha C-terminal domain-containing protein [Flavisolibacter sp.]|jgi:DNA-directed RNA polymerase alpha subunit|nr:DNA-directed RNA polymerase subunit alpha C-terminal domain-containing protein [Flavisolibacter sp.]